MTLPEGIGNQSILDTRLVMYPGAIEANSQQVLGTATRAEIIAFFDKDRLLAATEGYGTFELRVVGRLRDGRSFSGRTAVTILRPAGL